MAPHAHYFFVIEQRWLDDVEFAELYGICQALPGPNVVGMSIVLGDRSHGPIGSIVCSCALAVPPTILAVLVTALVAVAARNPATVAIEMGVTWGAAGLMMATGFRALYGTARGREVSRALVPVLITATTAALAVSGIVALPIVVIAMTGVAFAAGRARLKQKAS